MGVAIIGDIMLGRYVGPAIENFGLEYILRGLKKIIGDRSIIANLECPLIDVKLTEIDNKKSRFAAKEIYARKLAEVDVVALSLGNNHIFDFGIEGLINTQSLLKSVSIKYFGAGSNLNEAIEPAIIEVDNYLIGLISFSFVPPAKISQPGVAYVYDNSVELAISKLKNKVDFIIAMPHTGIELYEYPLKRDQNIYRKMIDLGVDLVVGSQAHCVQASEKYTGKYIFYSTGDLIFDHCHDSVWEGFNSEVSHTKKFSLSPIRDMLFYSIIILVDIENGELKLSYEPVINKNIHDPTPLDSNNKNKWADSFNSLNDNLQNNNEVDQQRIIIEQKLIKDLKVRNII